MSDSEEEITERQFKIALVGDPEVGKTSIATRYASGMMIHYFALTLVVVNKLKIYLLSRYLRQTVYFNRWGRILLKEDHPARSETCDTQGNQFSIY
jgi:hypothetical protein